MLFWLLAGLALYLVYIYVPALLITARVGLVTHLGSRDAPPEAPILAGRANRALANMKENLPFFLALGVLAFVIEGADMALATTGAMIFVLSRVIYLPVYMLSILGLRSLVYGVGLFGNVLMALALV